MSSSPVLIRNVVAVSFGGLLAGFVIAVTVFAVPSIAAFYPPPFSWTVSALSLALCGAAAGAIAAGVVMHRFGHQFSLRSLAVLYFISFCGGALVWDWYVLLIFLFTAGAAVGASSVFCPVYIAEISPVHCRGKMTALYQLAFIAGLLIGCFGNNLIAALMAMTGFDDFAWRVTVGIPALPSLLFLPALFFLAKSPRQLVHEGRFREAHKVLQAMGERDADRRLQEIVASFDRERNPATESSLPLSYRRQFSLAVSLALLTQLSGICALVYHWHDWNVLPARIDSSNVPVGMQPIVFGVAALIATAIAMMTIDRYGRRITLLIGSAGSSFCLAAIAFIAHKGINEVAVFPLLAAGAAFFAFSQGAVFWVYSSEVFPNPVRAIGQGVAGFSYWIMGAFILAVLSSVEGLSLSALLVFFASMTALQFMVALLLYPESKGLSLESLQKKLSAG